MDTEQLREELNFKVLTAVHSIVSDERRGLITKAQANTGIRGIFDAVSGLVSQDNFDLLSAASEEYKHAKGVDVTFIKAVDGITGTIRICGNGALLSYRQGRPMILPRYNVEEEVDLEARERQEAYHNRLVQEAQERQSW